MTDTTTNPDTTTTLVPPHAAKGVKAPKTKASKATPAVSKPATPTKAKAPVTRHVPAGARIDPDATVTCNVDIRSVKIAGNKNWVRAAGYPKAAGESKRLAACIKDGVTIGDIKYDWERGWLELDPPPAVPTKK